MGPSVLTPVRQFPLLSRVLLSSRAWRGCRRAGCRHRAICARAVPELRSKRILLRRPR